MLECPYCTGDIMSVERWFAAVSRGLEDMIGPLGAQAILARALNDARQRWPLLELVRVECWKYTFSDFHTHRGEDSLDGASLEQLAALKGLGDSLKILLDCLLGTTLTAHLMSSPDPSAEAPSQRFLDLA